MYTYYMNRKYEIMLCTTYACTKLTMFEENGLLLTDEPPQNA